MAQTKKDKRDTIVGGIVIVVILLIIWFWARPIFMTGYHQEQDRQERIQEDYIPPKY